MGFRVSRAFRGPRARRAHKGRKELQGRTERRDQRAIPACSTAPSATGRSRSSSRPTASSCADRAGRSTSRAPGPVPPPTATTADERAERHHPERRAWAHRPPCGRCTGGRLRGARGNRQRLLERRQEPHDLRTRLAPALAQQGAGRALAGRGPRHASGSTRGRRRAGHRLVFVGSPRLRRHARAAHLRAGTGANLRRRCGQSAQRARSP